MQAGEVITHDGIVVKTRDNGTADVEIMTGSACSGCHAKSACSLGNTDIKTINVKTDAPLTPGEKVTVSMDMSMGFKALVIGYIFPFVVLLTAFIVLTVAGAGELVSALSSFAAIGIYYLVVWMLRKNVEKKFEFKIKN